MLEKKTYTNGQKVYELENERLTYFFKTGIKKAEGAFINKMMEGEWIFYRENGQLWQKGNFRNNMKHGEFTRYDKNGQVEYHEHFENNKIIKKKK